MLYYRHDALRFTSRDAAITVEEAYLHCVWAVWRADLWNTEKRIDRAQLPTMGQMPADQIKGYDAVATDQIIQDNRHNLYGLD